MNRKMLPTFIVLLLASVQCTIDQNYEVSNDNQDSGYKDVAVDVAADDDDAADDDADDDDDYDDDDDSDDSSGSGDSDGDGDNACSDQEEPIGREEIITLVDNTYDRSITISANGTLGSGNELSRDGEQYLIL